jgi:hypothetical protein
MTVLPDIEIYRVANILMERFGDGAEAEVERLREAMRERGDDAGVAVYVRVLAAVAVLRRQAPEKGARVN